MNEYIKSDQGIEDIVLEGDIYCTIQASNHSNQVIVFLSFEE